MISIDIASNQNHFGLPSLMWEGASALKRVHRVWQLMIHGRLYANPGNYYGLLLGKLCNTSTFLKNASVPFYVTARLLDLYDQENAWQDSKIKWFEALSGVHPVQLKTNPNIIHSSVFLSGHTLAWLNVTSIRAYVRIQRVAMSSLNISLQTFKLLMMAMDVIELFNMEWSNLTEQSAKRVGIDAPRCLNVLVHANQKNCFVTKIRNTALEIVRSSILDEVDRIKAAEYADQLKSVLECFLLHYQMTTGIFGQAVSLLVKQGIYDWSPEYVKNKLLEYGQDPESMQRQIRFASRGKEKVPPVELMVYASKPNSSTSSPLKKPNAKSVPSSPVKTGIVYQLKSPSSLATVFTYKTN